MTYGERRIRRPDGQGGFTLLEIMVVIVILGLLASLTIPSLMGNKEKADRQKARSDIATLENSLDMYRLDNHRYPTTEQGLEALVEKPELSPIPKNYPEQGYIRRLPRDPWGNDYQLLNPGDHSAIDVFSFGPEGEGAREQYIGNWDDERKK
ncbi:MULTISPECIES: type II secretion system major pseudopilin GspG [unclassified Erwinia]|uniref:type II secretion system major pseudopilin GspG n=1 Tax=unclassified Erwinia TaxID=2622719 RepID=UPI000832CD0C|nr:type II secretion system major pseudopilin GspG [Erwinia sp. ErVv1]